MGTIDEAGAGAIVDQLLEPGERDAPLTFVSGPTRLVGGRSADLFRLQLSSGPADLVDRELVLRVLPLASSGRECAIQAEVAVVGYPTPEVLRVGTVAGSRSAMLMAHVDGQSMIDALGPLGALRRAPDRLAALLLELHRLDASALRGACERRGADDLDVQERALADIDRCLDAARCPEHQAVRQWFDDHRPAAGPRVVCHGDLHAFNVIVDESQAMVIDWELAGIGEAAFDVARTMVLIHAVPMELPRAIRPVIERLGGRAARRFAAAYQSASPIEPDTLVWYEALHAARMTSIVLAADEQDGEVSDPVVLGWKPTVPLLTTLLAHHTGVTLRPVV